MKILKNAAKNLDFPFVVAASQRWVDAAVRRKINVCLLLEVNQSLATFSFSSPIFLNMKGIFWEQVLNLMGKKAVKLALQGRIIMILFSTFVYGFRKKAIFQQQKFFEMNWNELNFSIWQKEHFSFSRMLQLEMNTENLFVCQSETRVLRQIVL